MYVTDQRSLWRILNMTLTYQLPPVVYKILLQVNIIYEFETPFAILK